MKRTLVMLGLLVLGLAFAQVYKFKNSGRLNTLFGVAQTQIAIADTRDYYPLSVFMDKINNAGESRVHTRELKGGLEYFLIAVSEGDDGISDINIDVFDAANNRIARDATSSRVASARFAVQNTQKYTFRISESAMGAYGDGFYSLMVAAKKAP